MSWDLRPRLARVAQKKPEVVGCWTGEGARCRIGDPEYGAELERLDRGVTERAAEMIASERLGRASRRSKTRHS